MTKPTPCLLILNSVLLASIYLLQSLVPTSADKRFILKTCNTIDDVNLCSEILLSNPSSINATSVTGLATTALDMAIQSAESASSQASGLSDKYLGEPEEEALNMCQEFWSEAIDDLREAQMEVGERNYSYAAELANDAQDGADFCENAFAERGLKSLMSDVDRAIHDRSGLAADILDMLDVP
jgi:pectinesterase inhibitor-like protein